MPTCRTDRQRDAAWLPDGAEMMVEAGELSDLEGSDCRPACEQTFYRVQKTGKSQRGHTCMASAMFVLDQYVNEVEQTPFFTLTTLLANIGGFMGLVFGYSLFSLADAAESAICDSDAASRLWCLWQDDEPADHSQSRSQSANSCWDEGNKKTAIKTIQAY